ncbi:MAG: general secretion pathway protein GspK [Rhodanobacteraceae bacterium]
MMRRRQRGTALLLVLWATMLLAALLIGVAAASRSHSEAALYGSERVRAELAAEAGVAHAVAGLHAPDLRQRWVPDGRPYRFAFDGAKVTVTVVDVAGEVDLNASAPDLLRNLFAAAGADRARAGQLVDALLARRSGVTGTRGAIRGVAGGLDARQARGALRAIDPLARLPGMDPALYARLAPSVTVFSGRNFPDASYAGSLALAALRGIGNDQARTLVAQRHSRTAQAGAGNGQAFGATANGPLVAGYGGMVERVFSTAVMPDGTRVQLDVTLRMALTGTGGRPYKVLDWRTDSAEMP